MKNVWLIAFFVFIHKSVWAQEVPVFSQFARNPYLYNPAFAGTEHLPIAYLTHRRQWIGIEGAPVTSVLTFHTPLKFRDRMGVGIKISNDSRGLLSTTSALVGLSYCLTLSEHQRLRFGLSAGVSNTQLLEYDPLLMNYTGSQFILQGEAGLLYQFKNTKLSFALPRLFQDPGLRSEKSIPNGLSPLRHLIFMASQTVTLSPRVTLEPSLLYRVTESLPNQFEIVGMVHLYDAVRVGASYRQDYGPSALAEFHYKENFSLGYAYELATSPAGGFSNGTHEIQLSLRLGKERKKVIGKIKKKTEPSTKDRPEKIKKQPKPDLNEPAKTDSTAKPNKPTQFNSNKPAKTAKPKKQPKAPTPPTVENEEEEIESNQKPGKDIVTIRQSKVQGEQELDSRYYVVIGAFNIQKNAEKLKKRAIAKGLYAEMKFSSETNYYYVYLLSSTSLETAIEGRDKIRNLKAYRDAWILVVE
jgi:type IX secretion system PorP/SprF family membrane protein